MKSLLAPRATFMLATNLFTFMDTNGNPLPLRIYRVVEP
jgi:hypothetical protein